MAIVETYTPLDVSVYDMMAHFWSRSGIEPDSEPGSILRTIFEAVGFKIEDISYLFSAEITKLIPVTTFEAFDFQPAGASYAQVSLEVERNGSLNGTLVIPAGYLAGRADGISYQTLGQLVLPPSVSQGQVLAVCTTLGAVGKTAANTVVYPKSTVLGIGKVTNPSPSIGGDDAESLEQQIERFTDYIEGIFDASHPALVSWAKRATVNGARAKQVVTYDQRHKPSLSPGYVEVYVDDGYATTPADLLSEIQRILEDHKAAGAVLAVKNVTPRVVNVTHEVADNKKAVANDVVINYFYDLKIGQKVSRENLITLLTNATGSEITLFEPTADVSVTLEGRAVLGVLSAV